MTLRTHYWLTLLALAFIFAAGSGFAWILYSSRSGNGDDKPEPAELEVVPPDTWVDKTLERLEAALDLRPEQIDAIREDIEKAGLEVDYVRESAMLEYHLLLLRLHLDLAPKLDPDQQAKLEESRKALQETFERRFSSLSEHPPEATVER